MDQECTLKTSLYKTLRTSLYKNIPIYRFATADIINSNIADGISLGYLCWYKQDGNKNNIFNPSTHIILANTLEEKEYFENNTEYNVVYANHNAFLNENDYIIEEGIHKIYDLVINSSFHTYKRRHLAQYIHNSVHIGYSQGNYDIEYPTVGYYANFDNNIINNATYKSLSRKDVTHIYNSSYIGGIFSEVEGACYSSSEYLLCGIPVLSTHSKGGRDIFYNEYNSILCNADKNDVKQSFDYMMLNIDKYDRYTIRNNHIKQMDEMRDNLTNCVKDIIEDKFKENVDFNELKLMLQYYKPGF